MKHRGVILVSLLVGLTMFLCSWTENNVPELMSTESLVLLVIDFDDFMCPLCLDSLLDFVGVLAVSYPKGRTWGIVIPEMVHRKETGDKSEIILNKKIRGFMQANQIEFPILFDRHHVFKSLAGDGTAIFILNSITQEVSRYVFPLDDLEIDLIFRSLEVNAEG